MQAKFCTAIASFGLLLVLLCRGAQASGPLLLSQLEHKKWSAAEGSPQNPISMIEDKAGLIWFTSPSGIYTFNGLTFTPFQMPPQVDPATAVIFTLSTSTSGNIWGASRVTGVVRIDPQHRVTGYGAAQGLPAHPVIHVLEDRAGEAWAIADGSLYHLSQGRWRDETLALGLPAGGVTNDIIDRCGAHWVATKDSLFLLHPAQHKAEPMPVHWEALSASVIEDPKGSLWAALELPHDEYVLKPLDLPGRPIQFRSSIPIPHLVVDARFDGSGALWITGKGVDRVTFRSASGATLESFVTEHLGSAEGLSSDSTRYMIEDTQGDVWVATRHGLDRFRTPVLIKASLPIIDSSAAPDLAPGIAGEVWLGGKEGPIYSVAGDKSKAVGPALDSYLCLFQDREGGLWFNSSKEVWHKQGDQLQPVVLPPGINPGRLRQVVQLADGSLLFTFYDNGVWRRVQDRWERTKIGSGNGEYPLVLFVDSHHALWAGYASGKVTRGDGSQEQIVAPNKESLGAIAAFYEGPFGLLTTGQRGIATVSGGRLRQLHFTDAALAENVTGLVQSMDGDLWLNGRNGVARIRAGDFQKGISSDGSYAMPGRLFTESDLKGPAPFFYDLPTAARDKTGLLWFNTAGSLVYIDPSSLSPTLSEPITSVIALLADGVLLPPGAPVPPGTHTLRIQYFGSNLTAPEDVRYRYRLHGVDDTWQYVEQRTEAVYTNLHPGNVSFEVSARNADNQWTVPLPIQIRVEPTFFQRPIFFILCAALLAALSWLFYRLRVAWLMRSLQERADARLDERVRLARDLHDTLLQGFQGLILRFHVAAQKVPEQTDVRDQLDGALLRAEKMMIEGRNRIVLLRADDLSGLNLQVALQSVCAELAENSNTGFSLENKGQPLELKALVKEELYWIAREALTNAFNHARAKEVRLLCDYGRREFRFICQDDGRGMDTAVYQAGRRLGHYGLPGMRERASKVNATFSCVSAPLHGTRIELAIPARLAYQQHPFISTAIRAVTSKVSGHLRVK